jgi:hypothetical protein
VEKKGERFNKEEMEEDWGGGDREVSEYHQPPTYSRASPPPLPKAFQRERKGKEKRENLKGIHSARLNHRAKFY